MIVATTTQGQILLGLDAGNIKRLVEGKPIKVEQSSHPGVPEGTHIVILYGETKAHIVRALTEAGLVGPDTELRGSILD